MRDAGASSRTRVAVLSDGVVTISADWSMSRAALSRARRDMPRFQNFTLIQRRMSCRAGRFMPCVEALMRR